MPSHALASVDEIQRRLGRPLQVAVAGKVSSGKSTLVNALLGRRVAQVRAGETRIVTTVYHRIKDLSASVTLVRNDNSTWPMDFTSDGLVPALPPDEEDRAERYEVLLDAPALASYDLVDTPGLYVGDPAGMSEFGRRALLGRRADMDTREAMRAAEAVLFLLTDSASQSDAGTLDELRRDLAASVGGFGVVAIVGKADEVDTADPFVGAQDQVAEVRDDLGPAVADVVCVSGLLAVAAMPGGLGSEDLALLRALAAADHLVGEIDQTFERFCPVGDQAQRASLLRRLGRYGVGYALRQLRAGMPVDDLPRTLLAESRLSLVTDVICHRFDAHSDLIKASAAMADLTIVALDLRSATPGLADRLEREIDLLRRRPEMHHLREAHVLDELRKAEAGLSEGFRLRRDMRDQLLDLYLKTDPHAKAGLPADATSEELLAKIAGSRAAWKRVSGDRTNSLALRRAADVVLESFARLALVVRAAADPAAGF
jgi:hypothetical protein